MESPAITTLLKQNLYILYGSQTGNAQEISREIYDLLKKSFNCKYSSLNDTIKNNNFIFINNISNSLDYIINLLKIIHVNYIKKKYKKIPNNVIYLDLNFDSNQSSFAINLEDKIKMINIGINKCKLFFLKLYRKNRKKYLSRKYFNIWKNKIIIKI